VTARRCRALALLAVAFAGASCSVAANLSADELMTEVDRIVQVSENGRELTYRKHAQVSLWYTRVPLLWPLYPPLYLIFGRTGDYELENPAAHVRELLLELPDETGSDLVLSMKASTRFGWVAQLDPSPFDRLVAIDGLVRVAGAIELPLFQGDFSGFGTPADPAVVTAALATIQRLRPDARANDAPPDEAALAAYGAALESLTAAPLENGIDRLKLLESVLVCYLAEPVDAVRARAVAPLRASLRYVIEGLLVSIVQDRSKDSKDNVDLRLCAMEQIRRLGGPRVVPLLLAVMASTPAQRARDASQSLFDPDWLVQLRLIQYCGQLRGEIANTTVRLPGHQGFEVVSPLDFLAITILNQDTYYSKLRTPALAALTWSLQRPRLDPDVSWVRAWREQHR
jgi:hypothetical protein